MSNPNITQIDVITDINGRLVPVGTDYDAVTIGGYRFGPRTLAVLKSLITDAELDASRRRAAVAPAGRIAAPDPASSKYPGSCDFTAAGSQDIFKIRVTRDDQSPDPASPYRWRAADGTTGYAATREAAAATADGYDAGRAARQSAA
jgi:hypothetical protein